MSLVLGYTELTQEIADFLGFQRVVLDWSADVVTRIDSIIKAGLRRVYYPQESKPGITHQWSWMRPEATIVTTAGYNTGTVEVASGVVTLSVAGTFPAWAAQGELHVGSQIYSVNTRDGDNQVTLHDLTVTVAAGSTYSLARPAYDLPEDFDGVFDGDLHYKTGDNTLWPAIRFYPASVLRTMKQNCNDSDRPLYAAIQPKTHDATLGQRWQIIFYPAPNAVWTFYGRYKIRPLMIDVTDQYPLGGTAMAELFQESCLAVAEERWVEDSTIHRERFETLLRQAIAHDADAFAPDFLGYNSDRSDGGGFDGRRDNAIHSYKGTVYRDVNP